MSQTLPAAGNPDLCTHYTELGNWARHYSTVRMTVTSILVPVSLLIIQYSRERREMEALILMISSAVVWLVALGVLIAFTDAHWKVVEKWRVVQGKLFPKPSPSPTATQVSQWKAFTIFHGGYYWDSPLGLKMDWLDLVGFAVTAIYVFSWVYWVQELFLNRWGP